ncbi:unnamed protein product [Didymodactylos carnosus]|uniref:Sacsin/Nov domain-containing protein n=1 Tax=Didymodactylos carnosus TaxID=1234261 RepID=A0A8S2VDV3_9BILA|nr:unnamed protein product [Didymodactylos carnosus]
MPSVTKSNPGRQCKVKLLEKFVDVLHTFLPSSFDLTNGTIFHVPLRVSQSEISDKVYRRSSMIKLLNCLVDELPNYMLFLKNVRSVKISTIDKNSQICSIDEVVVRLQSSDDESSKSKVRETMANIQNSSLLLEGALHSVHTYCVDISSTKSGTKSYLIADSVGFTPSIQKSIYKDVLVQFNTLRCLPVGACAYLLNEASIPMTLDSVNSSDEQIQQETFLYCFLPLPISSNIPVHVHGCFCLSNESRYNLWKTDNVNDVRRLWNEALTEHLLSQSYVQIVCRAAEQVQKHSLSIERYLTLCVDGTNKENLIQLLIKNAYETFFTQDLFIIPTLSLSPRIFVWTCASDSKLRFIREFKLFVSKSKECRDECITECLNSLLLIGLKICDRPKLLDLLKNDKNIMYDLNAIKLCDELRAYHSLHQKEILPIERTVFTFNSLYFFLSFILCDEKVQKEKLADCPLLLRADEKVCSFDEKKRLYGFHNVKSFQHCLEQFINPRLLGLFGTKELRKRWLKDLKISDLVDILPKVLNKDRFYRNNGEQFVQCEINVDVKRDMLSVWYILQYNLKSFLSDESNSTVINRSELKHILLKELDPIKH